MNGDQQTIGTADKKDGEWVLVPPPKDKSFFALEVGDEFIGTFILRKPNPTFIDHWIYVMEQDDGEIKQINSTTNLDKWMKIRKPGERLKIVRGADLKLPGKPKPLQRFQVFLWGKGKGN